MRNRYYFRLVQPASTYFEANVSIEADSEDDAQEKILKMSEKELEELAGETWEQGNDTWTDDLPIEIYIEGFLLERKNEE